MPEPGSGRAELRSAWRANGRLFVAVFVFSLFVNALMLTGPIFMLQVYDRVLGSRSEETLVALIALVAFLYLMMGLLDYARGRVMARAGARFQARLDPRVFSAVLDASRGRDAADPATKTGLRDLESVQRLFSSPALMALFDIPWTPVFIAAIFIFHPWLGIMATAGGLVLVVITLMNQWLTRRSVEEAQGAGLSADIFAGRMRDEAELVQALGMRGSAYARWLAVRAESLARGISSSDRTGAFTVASRTLRLFLQSAILALGAWLVLLGELTPGAMIAASILLGRALAPVEQAIGQWPLVQAAARGWQRLSELLEKVPPRTPRTALPKPRAILEARQISVIPPGERHATLRAVSFRLEPGQAMGVIGPSGAGKSTLARAIIGAWAPAGGSLRLDGATLDQYEPDVLSQHIGYLPQKVSLFDGTIAENIARLAQAPDAAAVVAAAKRAAVHDMIVEMPAGYDTPVASTGSRLSGGQIQRIGLARALYGDPVILVLDEPNANLDNEGSIALNQVVREMKAGGKAAIIMAHRPAAIRECDTLLVLEAGQRRAFGPRDEVLREMVANHADIRPSLDGAPAAASGAARDGREGAR